MFEIMEELDKIKVSAPINVGDVIVENILNTGVNIVSAKTV
jgi:CxxC motif-containing protein